ncbi:DUF3885 domain-containing protein [Brevibacillus agri]|uniref:DUF3885 domain-containing protein n=1 Tax=Brevibacillus TaxID=55080 RepID=UPI001EE5E1C0|nr:DUF3885 domain-containing protein [Brevibacillus agri]MCM3472206.1 DUF3885 domain-containing protein [Brevibacillus borstelensis]MCG5252457.1 DUF3885 domain-containing protein [Brevibacillus agri]MED1646697.1 DUF3885 domain-containing protein [Brevibacillus agri]MED1657703.1 DUF3885 domain-containing protein [Brevibacillus agri]MED1689504.1 DUF3885 domain-containing protein [Brevibacillus agri]
MRIDEYLESNFSNLKLRPPLFYNWKFGIRFELGDPNEDDTKIYMERVYFRAISLFKSLHSAEDEIMIVANVHHAGEENILRRRKVKIYHHYIKAKDVLHRLQHQVIPYVFEDVYEIYDFETHRYALNCQVADVKYVHLIKAICNKDMGIRPKIFHDVFFVNLSKSTIFHIYDDRGCDVIASSKESIRFLYEQYNDWILDYDRGAIGKVFQ